MIDTSKFLPADWMASARRDLVRDNIVAQLRPFPKTTHVTLLQEAIWGCTSEMKKIAGEDAAAAIIRHELTDAGMASAIRAAPVRSDTLRHDQMWRCVTSGFWCGIVTGAVGSAMLWSVLR